jgi:hypothetical protein
MSTKKLSSLSLIVFFKIQYLHNIDQATNFQHERFAKAMHHYLRAIDSFINNVVADGEPLRPCTLDLWCYNQFFSFNFETNIT